MSDVPNSHVAPVPGVTPAPAVTVPPPASVPLLSSGPGAAPSWLRWAGMMIFAALIFAPGLYLADDRYWLPLFTRYVALALFALSVDLVWGYTGLLSLGQGLYFGLGAYAMGYSLKLQAAANAAGNPHVASPDMALPDFMEYCRLTEVPWLIRPLINVWLALFLAVAVPALVAAAFGFVTFLRRIKGVYFSLITQALLLATFTLIDNQQPYTGGRVGMVNLAKLELLGFKFVGLKMYLLIAGVLSVTLLLCYALTRSKVGKVLTGIRDSEYRVLSLGYNTALYKTFVFALAGAIAGLAGALYVSALGTAGPDRFAIPFSLEVVVMVAVGGRGTLIGAVLGAVLVAFANTYFNDLTKDKWPFILGGLFIVVVVFLPEGIVGFLARLPGRLAKLIGRKSPSAQGA
jgi:urea transport system permease protein